MKTLSKKRKMLLALPVVVLPFMSLLLWATGVIGSADAKAQTLNYQKGLNTKIPDAKLEDETLWNKMRAYAAADADSTSYRKLIENDLRGLEVSAYNNENISHDSITRAAETRLKQLELLTAAPPVTKPRAHSAIEPSVYEKKMMERAPVKEKDPELEALNQMMEKIMDIQHPERVAAKTDNVQRATFNARKTKSGIKAVVAETQSLLSGSVVKLRLTEALQIDSMVLPKYSVVNGIAELNGERLKVKIESVRTDNVIVPVELSVFDLDGLEGIYIPGTITRENAKESAASAIGSADIISIDPSIKAQAAATGIGAVKNLLTKKARLVRVQVRSGYQVLIREPLN